jgi:predicted metal-dependent hydrolase
MKSVSDIKIDLIVRSRRRSFSIEIARDGRLIVRAPQRASLRAIRKVVEEKRRWIERKQTQMRLRCAEARPKCFVEGESFMYLGKAYPLSLDGRNGMPIKFDGSRFLLSDEYVANARNVFAAWYRERAREHIAGRVDHCSSAAGIGCGEVRITSARRRWGSCTGKGNLCFTWRLVMAPPDVIDYVVVHELAHIKHPNHSSMFWMEVASIMPDLQRRRRWLRENEHLLTL